VSRRVLDITLENLSLAPAEVLDSVFWELADDPPVEPRFEKEEWFSSTLLEWGPCGKLIVDDAEAPAIAFAEYAPGSLFPRLEAFPAGSVSPDAVYLSYCYVVERRRGEGMGTTLIRTVAREMADRGYRAVEALGDRAWDGSWVLPASFLSANGFGVIREDPRYPLMRLDLRMAMEPARAGAATTADLELPERPIMLPWPPRP
jgi:GNAT superfamily N-acetyltransferase